MSQTGLLEKSGSSRREPLLDLLRLFACFIVLLHHATVALSFGEAGEGATPLWQNIRFYFLWLVKYGHGTPVFFVLAGWLVMNTLEKANGDRRKIAGALMRRMKRILPPYWLALAFTALLLFGMQSYGLEGYYAGGYAAEFKPPSQLSTWQWVGNMTLTETWRALFTSDEPIVYTRVAWALCYHEQFIAVAILVALIMGRYWAKALPITSQVLICLQIILYDSGATYRFDGLFFDRWYCFAAGLMAYQYAHTDQKTWTRWFLLSALVAGVIAGWLANDVEVSISSWSALILATCSQRFKNACPDRLAVFIALISPWTYYIYLVHFPFETITNRYLYESGVQSFWARALIMVPVSMSVGLLTGVLFGHFVRMLENTAFAPLKWTIDLWAFLKQWRQWPQQIWQAVAVEPILLPDWHLFPKRAQGSVFDHLKTVPAGSLSDRTPFPNAAP